MGVTGPALEASLPRGLRAALRERSFLSHHHLTKSAEKSGEELTGSRCA